MWLSAPTTNVRPFIVSIALPSVVRGSIQAQWGIIGYTGSPRPGYRVSISGYLNARGPLSLIVVI